MSVPTNRYTKQIVSVVPVSYTHLDVYKRQLMMGTLRVPKHVPK